MADFIYPPVCIDCGRMTGTAGALCPDCWRNVRFIERPYCEVLGLPFDHESGEGTVSAAAIADPPEFACARAAVLHSGPARKMAHGLKYADRGDLAPMMAAWMLRAGRPLIDQADMLVAVPLHRRRLFSRSFNQSAELARALSKLTGKPQHSGLLVRNKATRQQVGLGHKARKENVRGAFKVPEEKRVELSGKHVLLIDDVMTTGATANSAAKALYRAGAQEVSVLTFSRVAAGGLETLYA